MVRLPAPKDPEKYLLWKQRLSAAMKLLFSSASPTRLNRLRNARRSNMLKARASIDPDKHKNASRRNILKAHAACDGRPSAWETSIANQISILDPTFTRQFSLGSRRFDLGSEHHKLLIELDGCYWHGCKLHPHKSDYDPTDDMLKTQVALYKGYRLVRIWEHDADTAVKTIMDSRNG